MDVQVGQFFPHSHLRIQAGGFSAIVKPSKVSVNTVLSFSQEKETALRNTYGHFYWPGQEVTHITSTYNELEKT